MSGVTVEELWHAALPPETFLAGGAAGGTRVVSGTAMLRARTPAFPTLHGGELAIVPLRLLHQVDPSARLDRLVSQLADAQVAGVILLDASPAEEALVRAAGEAADRHGIPVLACPPGHSTEAIDAALHRYLAGRREALLRRSQELQAEFTALAFAGKGLPAIVERVAEITGLPAAWEDRDLEVRAWAVPASAHGDAGALASLAPDVPAALRGARLPLLRWARTLSASATQDVAVLPLRADESGADGSPGPPGLPARAGANGRDGSGGHSGHGHWRRMIVPFLSGGEVAGYLSVLGRNGTLSQDARLALAGAGLAASIEALRVRAVAEAQGKATATVIRDWLLGRHESTAGLAAQLAQLGHTPAPPYAVVVLEGVPGRDLSGRVRAVVAPESSAEPLTTVMDEHRTVVLVPAADAAAFSGASSAIDDVLAELPAADPTGGMFAGIGRAAAGVEDVPRAYKEALQALAIARRLGGRHRVAYFGTLGVYRLLAAVSPDEELRGFHEDVLGPLLAYDLKNTGELLRTLEAYVESGGSVVDSAERLHTHRNTVLYRLDRIVEVLGMDVRRPEPRLIAHLALRAGDVLGQRAAQTR